MKISELLPFDVINKCTKLKRTIYPLNWHMSHTKYHAMLEIFVFHTQFLFFSNSHWNISRSTPCPAAKTVDEWLDPELCEAGDSCQYCHTRTEQQFHPEIYKSTKCNDMLEVRSFHKDFSRTTTIFYSTATVLELCSALSLITTPNFTSKELHTSEAVSHLQKSSAVQMVWNSFGNRYNVQLIDLGGIGIGLTNGSTTPNYNVSIKLGKLVPIE